MKGGCFGKILVFVFGMIVGIVLLAGTICGAGYYFVTQVTVNDVEKTANTEFTFIDKDAEIRDKSLYDIYSLVVGGDIKNITVAGVKKTFGVDIIDIIEKTLEITVDDSHRAELEALPVLQVFQGDNLKIVLNCVTLEDVLTKAGIDKTTLDSKPLISDRYDEPVIDAFNAILKELDFNALKIGDMEYLVGLNLGSGILDNLKDYAVSDLNSAINDITFEKILPDFDRDYYYLVNNDNTVALFYDDGYETISFTPAYVVIADGETVAAADRYAMSEDGIMAQADDGIYKIDGTLPLIEDRYAKAGDVYTQNRYGIMKVADGTATTERYVKNEDNTYTANAAGTYKKKYTTTPNTGTKYVFSYVKNFVETTEGSGVYVLEQRGYVQLDSTIDLAAADKCVVSTTVEGSGESAKTTNKLIEWTAETSAKYVLAHTGTSERMLQALADMTLNTLNDKIGSLTIGDVITVDDTSSKILIALKDTPIDELGDKVGTLKLGEVMTIDSSSSKILQQLQDTAIDDLSTAIDDLKLKDIVDIKERNIVTEASDGEYIALPALAEGKVYVGSYIEAYVSAESTDLLRLVKYVTDIDAVGGFFEGMQRYRLPEENKASSGILVSLADVTVKNLSNIEDKINESQLGKVIDIDGDVFVSKDYADIVAAMADDAYVYTDSNNDILRGVESTDTGVTYYKKVYTGSGNSIIKKMAAIPVNKIAERTQVVIDETKLSEVITIQKDNVLEAAADGKYIALPDGDYIGSYKTGVCEGVEYKLVEYKDGMTGTRYKIVTEASHTVLARMADKKIKVISTDMQSLVNDSVLGDVIDIDGDVYQLTTYTAYTSVPEADRDKMFTYLDSHNDILRLIEDGDTVIYEKIYTGADSAIIKKMAAIKVGEVASRIQTVVDETRFSEIITIQETYILEEDVAGTYIGLPTGVDYYGTYSVGRLAGSTEDIYFVKYHTGIGFTGTRYNVAADGEQSSGALVGMKDKKVGDLTSATNGMQSVIDDSKLSDVMDISGNVYTEIGAEYNTYVLAQAQAGDGVQIYYLDASGLFLKADASSTATEYFTLFYAGSSNAMLKKLATVTIAQLGSEGTMDKAVNDCTLTEVGVTIAADSLLYELRDTKIGDIDTKATELLTNATMAQLNTWANLELTDTQLNSTYTISGVSTKVGDMTVKQFVTVAMSVMFPPLP